MTRKVWEQAQRVKPLGEDGLAAVRKIMTEGYAKVNEVLIDSFSAGAIVSVCDALNAENRAKLLAMPVARVAEVSFKLINRSAA